MRASVCRATRMCAPAARLPSHALAVLHHDQQHPRCKCRRRVRTVSAPTTCSVGPRPMPAYLSAALCFRVVCYYSCSRLHFTRSVVQERDIQDWTCRSLWRRRCSVTHLGMPIISINQVPFLARGVIFIETAFRGRLLSRTSSQESIHARRGGLTTSTGRWMAP